MWLDDLPYTKEWFNCPLKTSVLNINEGKLLDIVDTYFCCETELVLWAKHKTSFVNVNHFGEKKKGKVSQAGEEAN